MSESRLVALARQAQNLQPERRTNTLSELRGRWSDYVNPYQTPPQQLSDLANPLRWPAMAVEGIQTAVETVPRMLQPGYDYSDTRQAAEDAFNVAGVVGAGSLLGTAAKPANAVGTFGGKLGGAASELDMSQAARMARAKEMGFDTDQVWYHGSPDSRGIWQDGFSSHYQRAGQDDPSAAYFFTTDRKTASTYADDTRAFDYQNAEPEVIEAYLRGKKILNVDAGGETFKGIAKGAVLKAADLMESGPAKDNFLRAIDKVSGDRVSTDAIVALAKRFGFDGINVNNVIDTYTGKGKPVTVMAIFDPSNIRSINAAFDPAKSDSANILASRGAPVPVEQRRRRDKDEIF